MSTQQRSESGANVAIVRPIAGEPTTFDVQSLSHPKGLKGEHGHAGWYRTDIAAHHGCGECQCVRWRTVCWPLIRDTRRLAPARRCRHLRAAREFALNRIIADHNAKHPSE